MQEVVEAQSHTVVEQVSLQSEVQFLGILPLNLVVTDVGQLRTDGTCVVAHGGIAGTSGIVRDTVVTADVVTGIQSQVVDGMGLGEPALVGHHPTHLHTGEDSPLHPEEAQSVCIFTETAVGLAEQ